MARQLIVIAEEMRIESIREVPQYVRGAEVFAELTQKLADLVDDDDDTLENELAVARRRLPTPRQVAVDDRPVDPWYDPTLRDGVVRVPGHEPWDVTNKLFDPLIERLAAAVELPEDRYEVELAKTFYGLPLDLMPQPQAVRVARLARDITEEMRAEARAGPPPGWPAAAAELLLELTWVLSDLIEDPETHRRAVLPHPPDEIFQDVGLVEFWLTHWAADLELFNSLMERLVAAADTPQDRAEAKLALEGLPLEVIPQPTRATLARCLWTVAEELRAEILAKDPNDSDHYGEQLADLSRRLSDLLGETGHPPDASAADPGGHSPRSETDATQIAE